MAPKLIVALDFAKQRDAYALIEQLDPALCGLKVGSELFTRLGPQFVKQLVDKKFKVFLDLKFHDIPNTVAKACAVAADLGVWMTNIHASGGPLMMEAAFKALDAYGQERPLLIAVTVLTSFNQDELGQINIQVPLLEQVNYLARAAKDAQLDGIVCSAHEASSIKELCGHSFITVTPGIRCSTDAADDQSRIMTPQQAVAAGSDYLVVGRSISLSATPALVVNQILSDIA